MVCKVFISSTTRDLGKYREMARDVIAKVNETFGDRFPLMAVAMDTQTQDGERTSPLHDSRRWVSEADWLVSIVAWNYGYVPPGAACSVTESEYLEAAAGDKPCFVFLPGELTDPAAIQYWPVDRAAEGENLAGFRGHPDQRATEAALNDFKARLRAKRFDLFSNIEDFRVKLTATLTNRIIAGSFDKLGPQILALGLQPPLTACFREVKLLATLKRLHDRLHQIRQFGLRRWRESLLVGWPDDGRPSYEALVEYADGLPEISKLIGEIKGLAFELPESLLPALPTLQHVTAYQFPRVPGDGKARFLESTEVFASRLQKSFTGCNAQMARSEDRLDRVFKSLTDSAQQAIMAKRVDPEREPLMQTELDRAQHIYLRLQQVLKNHYDWQRLHDELERIDTAIELELPGDDDETSARRARSFRLAAIDLADSGGAEVRTLLDSATAIVTHEDAERLVVWPRLILQVREHLDAFVANPGVLHYQAMRTKFDDLFFQIDRETLFAVETSEGRVRAMESGLRGIGDAVNPGA